MPNQGAVGGGLLGALARLSNYMLAHDPELAELIRDAAREGASAEQIARITERPIDLIEPLMVGESAAVDASRLSAAWA